MRGLAFHAKSHGLNSEGYFRKYKLGSIGCKCGEESRFINITVGFSTCKQCSALDHSNSVKLGKAAMLADPERSAKFRDNTSKAVANIWQKRKNSGEDVTIREKIRQSQIKTNSEMSLGERQQKYGWLNHLEGQEYEEGRKKILQTGCHNWWRTASEDDKSKIREKAWLTCRRTMMNNGQLVCSVDMEENPKITQNLNEFFGIK